MNRTQQSTAIAICLLGLAVLALGAVFLVREWREEVTARERLEEENAQLRMDVEKLETWSLLQGLRLGANDPQQARILEEAQRSLERHVQRSPNNDGS